MKCCATTRSSILWLAELDVPAGWHKVGMAGTKDECTAYVDKVWTDMRPRSLQGAHEHCLEARCPQRAP